MIRTQVLKHLSEAREGERGGRKRDVRAGTTTRGATEKSMYVWVIEGKRVRRDNLVESFFSTELEPYIDLYIIRVGVKRRKRVDKKLREG